MPDEIDYRDLEEKHPKKRAILALLPPPLEDADDSDDEDDDDDKCRHCLVDAKAL